MRILEAAAALLVLLVSQRAADACVCYGSPDPKSDTQITREIRDEMRGAIAVFSGRATASDT